MSEIVQQPERQYPRHYWPVPLFVPPGVVIGVDMRGRARALVVQVRPGSRGDAHKLTVTRTIDGKVSR